MSGSDPNGSIRAIKIAYRGMMKNKSRDIFFQVLFCCFGQRCLKRFTMVDTPAWRNYELFKCSTIIMQGREAGKG
jgi:hypothetical protein